MLGASIVNIVAKKLSKMNNVYCRYCGKLIDEDATFCTFCGREQIQKKHSFEGIKRMSLKITNGFGQIFSTFWRVIKNIKIPHIQTETKAKFRKIFKRSLKISVYILILGLIIGASIGIYSYYKYEYLPEKRLTNACDEIIQKLRSSNDSIKINYSIKILNSKTEWGYENVSDLQISHEMQEYNLEAFRNIENAAYNNNVYAQYMLGHLYYFDEYKVKNDAAKSTYWYHEAAQNQYIRAYNDIGWAYENAHGVNQNLKKAIEYYKRGAEHGDSKSQANYGRMFSEGVYELKVDRTDPYLYVFEKDLNEFIDTNKKGHILPYLKRKTIEGEESISWYDVDLKSKNVIIPRDINQAKYWWEKSAAQGDNYGKELLQKLYE